MGQSRPANNDGLKLVLLDTGHILQFLIELWSLIAHHLKKILIIIFRTTEISSRWILSPLFVAKLRILTSYWLAQGRLFCFSSD
jgi:hypothetical protein